MAEWCRVGLTISVLLLLPLLTPPALATCAELALEPGAGPCATVALGLLRQRALEGGGGACLQDVLAARGLPTGLGPGEPGPGAEPAAPPGGKLSRDLYALPGAATSENFAFRWGDTAALSEATAEAILGLLEHAWASYIEEWGYPPPLNSADTLFNVYLGSSGAGAPSDYGYGGYFTYDREGYPLVVLNRSVIGDPEGWRVVIAHEFFHGVQDGAQTYTYSDPAAWYFEATATWAAGQLYPEDPEYADYIYGYALFPHLPIDYFEYPVYGEPLELHQYGAFVFPQHLSENVSGAGLIRDSWVLAAGEDPLEELGALLAEDGLELAAVYAEFAARNATWDYAYGDLYEEAFSWWEGYSASMRLAGDHSGGSGGWREVSLEAAPRAWGSNLVRVAWDGSEEALVGVALDEVGSAGSAAGWSVTLVIEGEEVGYRSIELTGEELVDGLGGAEVLWLAVSVAAERVEGEAFGWSYRLDPVESGDTGERVEGKGCGCQSGGGGGWWFLGLGMLGWRRSRRL